MKKARYAIKENHRDFDKNKLKQILLVNEDGYVEKQWYKLDGKRDVQIIKNATRVFNSSTKGRPKKLNMLVDLEDNLIDVELTQQDAQVITGV